jgi:hypothetical protein
MSGDYLVPGYTQAMDHMPALHGRLTPIAVGTQHGLEMNDGHVIVNVLAAMK